MNTEVTKTNDNNRSLFGGIDSLFNDVFGTTFQNSLTRSANFFNDMFSHGLKPTISRPHNLKNVLDDSGNVVGQKLEIVTTPFAKSDLHVTIKDNVLEIKCKKTDTACSENANEKEIYHGISSQAFVYRLSLGDEVDQSKIVAENKDGILKIALPFKPKELPKEGETQVIDIV